ncbi:hypothetical protein YYE_04757 [Plasmodium vinckei vinckei]|uniref:Uncharacterized protein n=1 Tax=Plasmodium vinckei vinckei TaxID=54757 RepID=A0A081I988_PLAVN|nr:hypothetical protein YYE_04757 [Plasmodium vinckei vinckei]
MSIRLINTNPSFTTKQCIPTYEHKTVKKLVSTKQNTILNDLINSIFIDNANSSKDTKDKFLVAESKILIGR